MNIKKKHDELLKQAQDLIAQRKAAGAELTDEDRTALAEYKAQIDDLAGQITKANEDAAIVAAFSHVTAAGSNDDNDGADGAEKSRTVGEHFIKSVGDRLPQIKGVMGASITAPEFKAAGDNHVIGGWAASQFITDLDRNIVQGYRPPASILDLIPGGTISGAAISYLVEGAREGDIGMTAEGGAYSEITYGKPTPVTEALSKLTGAVHLSDEFLADADFLKTEIDSRLLYDLLWKTQQQVLSGNGTAPQLRGLLNRVGIQTELQAASNDSAQDAVFRAMTKVDLAIGVPADGIVINPADYQALRLAKDANLQYYGGGMFSGQYGQGGVIEQPPLWGTKTIVTSAIPAKTVLVGAFAASATLYRKGGVTLAATNSHDDEFLSGTVTVRADARVALAVRRPTGLVKVTLQ